MPIIYIQIYIRVRHPVVAKFVIGLVLGLELLLMAANHFSSVFSLTLVANLIMQEIIRLKSNGGQHGKCPSDSREYIGHFGYTLVLCKVTYRVFEPGYPDDPDHDSA